MRHATDSLLRRTAGRGFTLVEVVLSMIVVSVMLVVGLSMLGASAKARLMQTEQCCAMGLARQFLSEIRSYRYADADQPTAFGPESGEARATFDDVDDYNGYTQSPPTGQDGTALSGYDGWTWKVAVAWVSASSPETTSPSDTGLKRIAVTVVSPTGRTTTLAALRSRNSGYDQYPTRHTTYLGGVDLTVRAGDDSSVKAASGVNLLNQVP